MRHRLIAALTVGAALTIAPVALASSASAAPSASAASSTVAPDDCFAAGGFFGGYNSAGQAYCSQGTYDGVPFDHDPLQGSCPDGQHMAWVYLKGFVCTPNIPNS